MSQARRHRGATSRVSFLVTFLITGALLAVGGLFSTIMAANVAGAASSPKAKSIVIATSTNAQFGTILVSGKALYTLKASKTSCGTRCLKIWPEVVLPKGVTKARAGAGVNAANLGTVKRGHGVLQVTYFGKPLYRFSGDKATSQVHGNVTDAWGKWSVFVTATPTTTPPPASSTPTTPTTSPSAGASPSVKTPSAPPATTSATSPPPTAPPPTTTPVTSPPTTDTAPSSGGVAF